MVRCKKFEEFVLVDLVCRSIGRTLMGPFTSPCRFGQCPTSSQRPSDQSGGNRSTQIDLWDFCRILSMPGGGHSLLDWSEPIQKTLPDFSLRHAASRPSINASDSPSMACKESGAVALHVSETPSDFSRSHRIDIHPQRPEGYSWRTTREMKPLHKDADLRVAGRPNLFAGRNSSQDSEETRHDDDGQLLHGVPVELAMAQEIRHPLTRVNEHMKHHQISRANPKPSIPPTVHTWTGSMASH